MNKESLNKPYIQQRIVEDIAHNYVRATKTWTQDEYSLRVRRTEGTTEFPIIILDVVHKDDLIPKDYIGGGKSVQLYIDVKNRKVLKELYFQ